MEPVSVGQVVRGWQLDPASLQVIVFLALVYAWLVWRGHQSGRRWPVSRMVAAGGATAAAVVATQSGIGRYDDEAFTVHMIQHLLLGMVTPFLAALAAPVLLVLQHGTPTLRSGTRRMLRSRAAKVIAHPVVTWLLFGGGMVVIYLTPVLGLTTTNSWVHLAVHAHLVLAGFLYLHPLVGNDPSPRPLPHTARLLSVLTAVPFHAVLGMALLSAERPLAPDAYPRLSDQRTGAGLFWGMGELFTLAVAAVVVRRWYVTDQREAARSDRRDERRADSAMTPS